VSEKEITNVLGILKGRIEFEKVLVEFTGYKSCGKFANATESHCLLVVEGNNVTITPSFRDGRGFSHCPDKDVTCELTVEAIGMTLFAVLRLGK
jgi:hypothetical protein